MRTHRSLNTHSPFSECTLQHALDTVTPPEWGVKVHKGGMAQRQVRTWMGGALVSSLSTFPDLCVTRAQYQVGAYH
jgi:actin-related protein